MQKKNAYGTLPGKLFQELFSSCGKGKRGIILKLVRNHHPANLKIHFTRRCVLHVFFFFNYFRSVESRQCRGGSRAHRPLGEGHKKGKKRNTFEGERDVSFPVERRPSDGGSLSTPPHGRKDRNKIRISLRLLKGGGGRLNESPSRNKLCYTLQCDNDEPLPYMLLLLYLQ